MGIGAGRWHPFQVTDETKRMVLENISFVLGQFLRCSAYETVLFCWVMQQDSIAEENFAPFRPAECPSGTFYTDGIRTGASSTPREGCDSGPPAGGCD